VDRPRISRFRDGWGKDDETIPVALDWSLRTGFRGDLGSGFEVNGRFSEISPAQVSAATSYCLEWSRDIDTGPINDFPNLTPILFT
jgi:hypothetical protein